MISSAVSLVLKGVLKRFLKNFQIDSETLDPSKGWQSKYKFTVHKIEVREDIMNYLKVPFLKVRKG